MRAHSRSIKEDAVLEAIGEALPLAVAIAISPLGIIAAVLMLLSARPAPTSLGLSVGFVASIAAVMTGAYLISRALPHADDGASISAPFIVIALGLIAIALAVRQWLTRLGRDGAAQLPGWMSGIDGMSALAAIGLGVFFGGINPMSLLLGIAAGVSIEATAVSGAEAVLAITVITIIASSSIIIPVAVSLIAGVRMRGVLDRTRAWMITHNAAMVAAILLLLGVLLVGKGLSALAG